MLTCKDLIMQVLKQNKGKWLIPEELGISGYSINNICSRLPELARSGYVESRFRKGQCYKEWHFVKEYAKFKPETIRSGITLKQGQTQAIGQIQTVESYFKQLTLF